MKLPEGFRWRGGHLFLVVLVATVVVALYSRVGAPGVGADPRSDARLMLAAAHTWSFEWSDAPITVAALDSGTIAFVPPDGRSLVLDLDGHRQTTRGFAEADISTVAPDPYRGEFWVGAGTELFTVAGASGRVVDWGGYRTPGPVTSVARTGGSLWATYRAEAEAWVVELRIDERQKGLELVGRHKVGSGSAVVHRFSDTSVIVQDRLPPYALYQAREGTGITRSFRFQDGASSGGFAVDTASWVANSAVPLQEELVVQWLVDLRSTRRAAVVVNVERLEVQRITEFDAPVGLVHSFADGEFVLGAHEVPGGREIVVYRVGFESARSMM